MSDARYFTDFLPSGNGDTFIEARSCLNMSSQYPLTMDPAFNETVTLPRGDFPATLQQIVHAAKIPIKFFFISGNCVGSIHRVCRGL